VEQRIKSVERVLDSLEQNIQRYKTARGIVDLSEQGRVFLKNVGENDQRLSSVDIQLAVLDKLEDYVIQKDSSAKIVPSSLGISDDKLSTLIERLYETEVQYARLKKTTAENNPILLSLQTDIENMRPGILENIRNQKASLYASRAKLVSANNKYGQALTSIPESERQLLEANRQHAIKNDVYTYLLQKREETALSTGATNVDSRLVDKAESSVLPVAPRKIIVFGGAFAFAMLLAVGWVGQKELLNTRVLFRSEIESLTKIPVAGEIIDSQMKSYVVIDNLKKPYLTEQFTQLRVTAGLHSASSRKVLMVTSSIAGEGKSFICTNFAISMAGSKQRVLLVDLDLRNPRISNLYGVVNTAGLAEHLTGDAPLEKVIRRTSTQNLYLLPAGRRRINATGKLLSSNLRELIERLKSSFDYIVIDTPPITSVVDATVISPFCDATFFVVRHGKTPKSILRLVDSNDRVDTLKNVSIVFNGIRARGLVTSAYGYGYGYGYEYEYTDGSSNRKSKLEL
jgi:capsular exopolysaccharide synthesis family protein